MGQGEAGGRAGRALGLAGLHFLQDVFQRGFISRKMETPLPLRSWEVIEGRAQWKLAAW